MLGTSQLFIKTLLLHSTKGRSAGWPAEAGLASALTVALFTRTLFPDRTVFFPHNNQPKQYFGLFFSPTEQAHRFPTEQQMPLICFHAWSKPGVVRQSGYIAQQLHIDHARNNQQQNWQLVQILVFKCWQQCVMRRFRRLDEVSSNAFIDGLLCPSFLRRKCQERRWYV